MQVCVSRLLFGHRSDLQPDDESNNQEKRTNLKPFSEMLNEYGKPTLSRFQMFVWTWICIGIYLAILFTVVYEGSI